MLLGRLGNKFALGVGGRRSRLLCAEMVMVYWSLPQAGFSGRAYACAGVSTAGLTQGSVVVTSTSVVLIPVNAGSGACESTVPFPPPEMALSWERFWKISTPTRT